MPYLFRIDGLNLLLDLGSLAQTVAQVVELSSADLTVTDSLDLDDVRRMDGENLFAADAVGDTTNGEGFLNTAVLLGDNGALENLNSFTGTFLDFDMNANGVTDVNFGQFFLHVLAGKSLNEIHNIFLLPN